MVSRFEHFTLEHKIDPCTAEQLRSACTASWDQDFVATEEGRLASDEVVFRRHDRTVRRVLSWLGRFLDLPATDIIDFGSGCGSSALAFSKIARSVQSFEIDEVSCAAYRQRMELFGVSNAHLTQCAPDVIFERAAARIGSQTSIMLVAVVEHLLEHEQVAYFKAFWERLAPGQILAIMETPNYLAYFDTHTFKRAFAHYVPDSLFRGWVERQPDTLRFKAALLGSPDTMLEQRRRLGLGVTAEPFEQAFGMDLNETVVGDGFDPEMLEWFPMSFDDRLLLTAFRHYATELPVGFAKNVLSFAFRKPRNVADANSARARNEQRKSALIASHAFQG